MHKQYNICACMHSQTHTLSRIAYSLSLAHTHNSLCIMKRTYNLAYTYIPRITHMPSHTSTRFTCKASCRLAVRAINVPSANERHSQSAILPHENNISLHTRTQNALSFLSVVPSLSFSSLLLLFTAAAVSDAAATATAAHDDDACAGAAAAAFAATEDL